VSGFLNVSRHLRGLLGVAQLIQCASPPRLCCPGSVPERAAPSYPLSFAFKERMFQYRKKRFPGTLPLHAARVFIAALPTSPEKREKALAGLSPAGPNQGRALRQVRSLSFAKAVAKPNFAGPPRAAPFRENPHAERNTCEGKPNLQALAAFGRRY
jgi:hypothetical protein